MHIKLNSIAITLQLLLTVIVGTAQNDGTHALIGVEIFNGESNDLKGMTILVSDGLITDIYKDGSKPISDSINRIYLEGHYIIPGLIDTHVHMGQKRMSVSREAARKEFRRWIYSGVTSVRDMGGDVRALRHENQMIRKRMQPGPEIYFSATVGSSDQIAKDLRLKRTTQGIGIEKSGYVIEAKTNLDVAEKVAMAAKNQVSGLKFYAGVNSDLIRKITDEAHRQGLKSWAHFTVFPDRPIEVVRAGVDVVSHVWGAFWQDSDVNPAERIPFTHTDFKNARSSIFPDDMSVLNTDSPELELLFKEMRERKVIWDLTYAVPNPETRKIYKKYVITAAKAGVNFSTGTDRFNEIKEPFPEIFNEIESLVTDGILDTREALLAATLHGAKAIGIENTHGAIEKGKIANLVVLKNSPIEDIGNVRTIEFTMKNGIIYHRKNYSNN